MKFFFSSYPTDATPISYREANLNEIKLNYGLQSRKHTELAIISSDKLVFFVGYVGNWDSQGGTRGALITFESVGTPDLYSYPSSSIQILTLEQPWIINMIFFGPSTGEPVLVGKV